MPDDRSAPPGSRPPPAIPTAPPVVEIASVAAVPDAADRSIEPEAWPAAIRVLVGGQAATARRVLDRLAAGSIRFEAIAAARTRDGRIGSVAAAVRNPGRTLGLVLSPIATARDLPPAGEAIRGLLAQLASTDAALVQAMFDPARRLEISATRAAGFRDLARLRFMEADLDRLDRSDLPLPEDASIEPCGDAPADLLAPLLARTYEGTLDCPGLAGLRRTEDVLAGHRGSGRMDPTLWRLLRIGGVPAGIALLNPNPEADCTELVYFGLVPEARGRGLAATLLRDALRRVGGDAPRRIALAVDDRNGPALRLYRRAGFAPGGLRDALVRPLA